MTDITARLRAALTRARRERDRETTSLLRSALAAISNAEAEGIVAPRAGAIEASVLGVGAAEAPRRHLDEAGVRGVVEDEITELLQAAAHLDAHDRDQARQLRAGAQVLRALLA